MLLFFFTLWCSFAVCLSVPPSIMTTYAGMSSAGDGGYATSAQLFQPCDVAVDRSGNLFIADTSNNKIRLVAKGTGIITTYAGSDYGYKTGNGGDGGPATSAEFSSPFGICVDTSDNVYIADTYNRKIRLVTRSTGIVTTFAGTGKVGSGGDGDLATNAQLYFPNDVTTDTSGNVVIADTYNNKIRLVTKSTGIITTYAGSSTGGFSGDGGPATNAELSFPSGVVVDASGNLYISDTNNGRIRLVTKSTGIISTFAGPGASGLSGDGGPATSATLDYLRRLALDASGNLYIPGSENVRTVTMSTGIISTYGQQRYSGGSCFGTNAALISPNSIAIDTSGSLYFADSDYNVIGLLTTNTGDITAYAGRLCGVGGTASSSQLYFPYGVAVDTSGNLYVADNGNRMIRLVTKNTGILSTFAGNGLEGSSGDGGPATGAQLYGVKSVATDASGNVYIGGNTNVRLVTKSSGIISTFAGTGRGGSGGDGGPATSASLYYTNAIAFDASGNLYIAESYTIRMVTRSTGIISTFAGTGASGSSGDGGPATSASLSYPRSIAFDASGNLYIAGSYKIRMVTRSTGIISTFAGTGASGSSGDSGPATSAALTSSYGLAFDASGNLYIADGNKVRVVAAVTSTISTYAGTGTWGSSGDGGPATSAQLYNPFGLAFDALGNLYIADTYNNVIRVVLSPSTPTPSSAPTRQPTGQPTRQPTRLPTTQPTDQPSSQPTIQPTRQPSSQPTMQPSQHPTTQPTLQPQSKPSSKPSCKPTPAPTTAPTQSPSVHPTHVGDTNPPTFMPSVAPSATPYPSLFPSFAPVAINAPIASVQVMQTVAGVTSDSPAFRATFAAAVASLLPSGSNVTIISVTYVSARQLRTLLSAGVSVVYKVSSTQPVASLTAALSTGSAKLTTALQQTYPAATVYVPTVYTAPSSAPTPESPPLSAPAGTGASPSSTPLIAGVVGGVGGVALIAAVSLLLQRAWRSQQRQVATSS